MEKLTPFLKSALNVMAPPFDNIIVWKSALVATDGKRYLGLSSNIVSGEGFIHKANIKTLIHNERQGAILALRLDGTNVEADITTTPNVCQRIRLPAYHPPAAIKYPPYFLEEPHIWEAARFVPTRLLRTFHDDALVYFAQTNPTIFYIVEEDDKYAYSIQDIRAGLPALGEMLDVWTNQEHYLVLRSREAWYAIPPIVRH